MNKKYIKYINLTNYFKEINKFNLKLNFKNSKLLFFINENILAVFSRPIFKVSQAFDKEIIPIF